MGLFSKVFHKTLPLEAMTRTLPREEILKRGRIAILDDDPPEILPDLREHGLSVDHIPATSDQRFVRLEQGFYDVLLLDFGGIGARFGPDDGLDVLRHLKRVVPGLKILAFTARTFDSSKADFFRLCDGVIKKDAGIRHTLERLELELAEILTPAYQWHALQKTIPSSVTSRTRDDVQWELSQAIRKPGKRGVAIARVSKILSTGWEKAVEAVAVKLIEIGIRYVSHGMMG
jgi:DNA-binding NarL/FixJ family response regulator